MMLIDAVENSKFAVEILNFGLDLTLFTPSSTTYVYFVDTYLYIYAVLYLGSIENHHKKKIKTIFRPTSEINTNPSPDLDSPSVCCAVSVQSRLLLICESDMSGWEGFPSHMGNAPKKRSLWSVVGMRRRGAPRNNWCDTFIRLLIPDFSFRYHSFPVATNWLL